MKKWIIPTLCAVCALFLLVTNLTGKKGSAYRSIGNTYNEFLFIPAKSAHFTITFLSPFTGSLRLIDENGNPLPASKYTIYVDRKKSDPSFTVNKARTVAVSIRCSKNLSPGKHYIQVDGGGKRVTKVYFKHHLNPLVVWLSWIVTLMTIVILVWFLLLRPMVYPQFRSCQKTILVPGQAPIIIKMTGARLVVVSSVAKKQSFWDALIKGPVVYKVHPAFTSPISMRPVKSGRILVKADSGIYRVSPNPIPRVGVAAMDNVQSNLHITIN